MSHRASPRRHAVHTVHPRYRVSLYLRGTGIKFLHPLESTVEPQVIEEEIVERKFVLSPIGKQPQLRPLKRRPVTEYRKRQYERIFKQLKNITNWKDPTERAIVRTKKEADYIANALAYFQGGAEIQHLSDGTFRVGSKGYYHYIGA